MRVRALTAWLVPVCWAGLAGAQEPAVPGMLEFMAETRARVYTNAAPRVLAFYYTWYGRPERQGRWLQWGGEDPEARAIPMSTHYPVLGAYDSHDPQVIDTHLAQARACGVTGFVATWWGQGSFTDQALQLLLDRAGDDGFAVSAYWEAARGEGQEQVDRAVDDLVYLVTRYGAHPAFLRVDGTPVLFFYGRVRGDIPVEAWPEILTRARARAGDFLLIADGYTETNARLFDGLHTYNICVQVQGRSPDEIRAWSSVYYPSVVDLARSHGRISCVTVIPGYDDTKIRHPGIAAARHDGQTYRVLWEEALRAGPDWVLITSWNEWHEGSEIEPSDEHGDAYLALTGEYAPRLMEVPRPPPPPPPARLDDARLQVLRDLYRGRSIGVLPGFGDAALWLLDAGLDLREVPWTELTGPAAPDPAAVPLLLHAGDESYPRSVQAPDDLVPAIQRYLGAGGFLLSLPHQPFPFFRDADTGEATEAAPALGLPVRYGWERPGDDDVLLFRFDTEALPGLPDTAPFPERGDRRWRPADPRLVEEAALYTPLATLAGADGANLGEGIVHIEHRAGPLAGGQTLYAWMRMTDVVDRDTLLFSLFRYAGERLAPAAPPPADP